MRRWQITLAVSLALALMLPGCAIHRAGNPFAVKGRKQSDPTADQKSASGSDKAADTLLADQKNTPRDPARSPPGYSSTADGAAARAGAGGGHDPQTMAYIESELRDA